MKKFKALFLLLIILFSFSACEKSPKYMDKLHTDGSYHYSNKDLKFEVVLPSEFIYYQTQRIEGPGYIDIEFFVPTSDRRWHIIPGYAKPIIVRVYEEKVWEEIDESEKEDFLFLDRKKGNVYTIQFWEEAPEDWTNKWTDTNREYILNNFNLK